MLKLPQEGKAPGISVVFSQLPLAYWKKSVQAETVSSMRALSKPRPLFPPVCASAARPRPQATSAAVAARKLIKRISHTPTLEDWGRVPDKKGRTTLCAPPLKTHQT